MSEAIRFPEDYDGIISSIPANNASVNEIAVWHLWRQTHDAAGKAIFTAGEMRTVSDAAVDYRTPKEPAPFAGHTIADARLPESDIDGFLALAAERCPSFGEGGAQIAPFDCVNDPPLSWSPDKVNANVGRLNAM